MTELEQLVVEAQAIAGSHPCTVFDHMWESVGGRNCPHDCPDSHFRSQPVYRCMRCGEYDYGYNGGPGYRDCVIYCGLEMRVAA